MTQIRAMTEQDVPSVSLLIGESWRRTYSPIMGAETAARIRMKITCCSGLRRN
ncbi:hypothetical protein IQ26_07227 [Mesorhizobium tianshanense]|uniref:Uncharacterized protein n=1 Tax=Mesorhizobium tianshanense TaxID=39844 RepID=A0A562MGA7_9HYPH|nr:hypothetical protein IQ26_07227 [Mesorhizobium tianshanense]